jgi:hypothetical protein
MVMLKVKIFNGIYQIQLIFLKRVKAIKAKETKIDIEPEANVSGTANQKIDEALEAASTEKIVASNFLQPISLIVVYMHPIHRAADIATSSFRARGGPIPNMDVMACIVGYAMIENNGCVEDLSCSTLKRSVIT